MLLHTRSCLVWLPCEGVGGMLGFVQTGASQGARVATRDCAHCIFVPHACVWVHTTPGAS